MPRLCYGSAQQVNLFCSRLNRKVHFSVFSFISAVRGGGVCECEYVNLPMYFTFSHSQSLLWGLSVKYCLGIKCNLIYKLIYKCGYTYIHSHWYIYYYSQYLYIVWMYIFYHTEGKYIEYYALYISLTDIYNYYSYWYYLVICECESVKYIGKFTYSHSHFNLIAISL